MEVESDSLLVINALKNKVSNAAPFSNTLDDIHCIANLFFFLSFSFIPRLSNVVAHSLARWAIGLDDFCFLLEDVPPCVQSAVLEDFSSFS